MRNEFTAIIEQDGEWYVGYCPEIPGANGQGRTVEECRQNLTEAVSLILEDRREDALRRYCRGRYPRSCGRSMKRGALLRHLRKHGCFLKREGKEHSLWSNPKTGHVEAVPRHNEISNQLGKNLSQSFYSPVWWIGRKVPVSQGEDCSRFRARA